MGVTYIRIWRIMSLLIFVKNLVFNEGFDVRFSKILFGFILFFGIYLLLHLKFKLLDDVLSNLIEQLRMVFQLIAQDFYEALKTFLLGLQEFL